MPKLFHSASFGFLVFWFFGIFPAPVIAVENPIIATVSATATVQRITPTTSDTTAPTAPILIRPVDGTITGDNHPEFVWHYSTDDNSNTVRYTLYLNEVATFLGISGDGNSSGEGYTARLEAGDIRLLPTTSLPDGIYSWRVDAYDLSGNTSHSTTWHFVVDTHAPPLTLLDLDTYHEPVIVEGANFDIAGPKDIYFTVLSDPFITIQITITAQDSTLYHLASTTNASGLSTLYQHLTPGLYSVTILAIDRSGNTTILPDFTLTITQAQISLPAIPGITPPIVITYSPFSIPSLSSTIAKIETRLPLVYLIALLLAVLLLILLIILWRRRYNLLLLNSQFRPIQQATIYHSLPPLKSGVYHLTSVDHGRLYIPHLGRYSTLTIRIQTQDLCTTYILSISAKRRVYTLILG